MDEPTVYLVDDNDAFRQSTTWVLEAAGLTVHDYPDAPALIADLDTRPPIEAPSCVVTDVRMPEMSGLELLEVLYRREWALPVILITAHGDVPLAVEAMRRGACNFLEKPFESAILVDIIRLSVRHPAAIRNLDAADDCLARLSPRETEVMKLVCAGKLNKTIADILGISIKTVELHRANMMNKLHAKSIPELVRIVLGYQ